MIEELSVWASTSPTN